jgi:fibronectin-binding autotransporter adhesin
VHEAKLARQFATLQTLLKDAVSAPDFSHSHSRNISDHRHPIKNNNLKNPVKPKVKSNRHLNHIVFGLSIAALFPLATQSTHAATETWSGATATWNTAGNWTGTNLPPISGDSLIFGAAGAGGTSLNNDLTSAAFTIAGMTFSSGASAYTIGGNAFSLTSNITNSSTSPQILNNAITLGANQNFNASSATGSLTLGGTISGPGVTLTTSTGATAGVSTSTVFTGGVTLGSLVSQGTTGNNPTSAPQSGGIYTAEQSTSFNNATLSIAGNAVVGRSNLIFTGSTVANVTGSITTVGAASMDWASVLISGSANVTATSLNMTGSTATGQFYLNGGTLTVGSMAAIDSSNATFPVRNVFNGTQVIASQSNANFLTITKSQFFTGGSTAHIGNNGALFNTNGFNIGTGVAFANDTGATGILTKSGSGILTLTGSSTYTGATTINGGTLKVNGTLAAGSAVNVNGGGALGGTGTVNGPVTVAAGSSAETQGAVNLVDGGIGTLTLSHAGGLTIGAATGNSSKLMFDVNGVSSDFLSLGANPLNVGAGGAEITISGVGMTSGSVYTLVNFGSGTGAGFATGSGTTVGELTLANPNISFGVQGSLEVTATDIQLVTSGASAPGIAYWSGVEGSSWTSNDGTNGNFTENADGTGFVGAYPANFTDIIFAANGNGAPTNLTNTLGQDFSIYSLTFANGTAATHISGANQLSIDGGGITLEDGNGGATLAMNTLALANFQTWSNASSSDLTVSAIISGSNGLAINNTNTGTTNFSGANTYSGGTTLTAGTLKMSGTGTLGATGGSLTVDGGTLDLNGTSQSVGLLSGTGGTILNNSTATNVTLTIGTGNANGSNYGGVIADNTSGTGTVALTKAGTGTVTLSGTNTYSGKTTINGGTLQVGANETIPNASVVEINNGGKLNILAFTETIGGLSSTAGNTNLVQNQETGGAGTGTLIIDTAGSDYTFDGIIRNNYQSTGTLAVVKNGAGTQTITATNNLVVGTSIEFTGGLTINGGTFRLLDQGITNVFYTNGKVIATFASDVTNNGTFALENTGVGNVTFSKNISGNGAVTTAGLVTLSGTNTYTGNTTINSGTLSTSLPYLADSSTVSIASSAKLNLNFAGTDVVASLLIDGTPASSGTWGATGSGATNIDNTHFSGTGVLQVGAVTSGYATWATTNTGGQGPDLDFDGDGVRNGVEYFMGETGSTFTANPGVVGGKVTWPKDPAYVGTYTVQTSPDLVTWTNVSSTEVGDTVEYTVPTGMGKLFVRLFVTPSN